MFDMARERCICPKPLAAGRCSACGGPSSHISRCSTTGLYKPECSCSTCLRGLLLTHAPEVLGVRRGSESPASLRARGDALVK